MGRPSRGRTDHGVAIQVLLLAKMGDDVQAYVKSCLVCQLDKTKKKKMVGLLQPLPILERSWQNISMDFITGFPKARECKSIFVMIDRFSKYSVFMAALKAYPYEEATNFFFVMW